MEREGERGREREGERVGCVCVCNSSLFFRLRRCLTALSAPCPPPTHTSLVASPAYVRCGWPLFPLGRGQINELVRLVDEAYTEEELLRGRTLAGGFGQSRFVDAAADRTVLDKLGLSVRGASHSPPPPIHLPHAGGHTHHAPHRTHALARGRYYWAHSGHSATPTPVSRTRTRSYTHPRTFPACFSWPGLP
jgi:hypothetical protein